MALTLPRNVQHSYVGIAAVPSSLDDTGTKIRPAPSATAPVTIASGCVSTFVFQRSLPFMSSAYAVAVASPKKIDRCGPLPPTTGVDRTPASASNVQTMQPELASSA